MSRQACNLKLSIRIGERSQIECRVQGLIWRAVNQIKGRIVAEAGITPRTDFLKSVVNAIPAANDCFVVQRISEADSRCEVVLVRCHETWRSMSIDRNILKA